MWNQLQENSKECIAAFINCKIKPSGDSDFEDIEEMGHVPMSIPFQSMPESIYFGSY